MSLRIGSSPENDIVYNSAKVSGRHAEIAVLNNGDILLKDKDSTIKFYKEKSEERLERIEGLKHEIVRLNPNYKNSTIFECSSLANKFPYADEALRKEVRRSNARENMLLDEMCEQKGRYDELLKKYWELKRKYEPEASSGSDEGQVMRQVK